MKKFILLLLILILLPSKGYCPPPVGGGPVGGVIEIAAETDPIVGAINGIVEADGAGNIGAATEGVDYSAPGGTDIAIADGGTGASTAAGARANLDVDIPNKSFAFNALIASDDFLLWRTPVAITITDIHGVLQSGTNVVGGLDECDANGANPVAVDADIIFDGGLDQDDGALTNGTIDAGDWIRWHTTSVSSPGYLTVVIYYTID